MTKEEYEELLKTDYWKGYSYSLIKERNFTCEDCGRKFLNERNKLQVHHLVYRDVNPWSYRPEELVVLCEECHKKRHGMMSNVQSSATTYSQETYGGYTKSYSFSTESKEEKHNSSDTNIKNVGGDGKNVLNLSYPKRRVNIFTSRYVLIGLLLIILLPVGLGLYRFYKQSPSLGKEQEKGIVPSTKDDAVISYDVQTIEEENNASENHIKKDSHNTDIIVSNEDIANDKETATIKLQAKEPERDVEDVHNNDVVQKEQNKENTSELSTLELLEKKNHADVVKQAKRAGVSTEGSTLDILERINHTDVVKQAKRAGVSTEGSTLDILERINHADVVKQAKRAGVSTEGSTLDILERINRKELERLK